MRTFASAIIRARLIILLVILIATGFFVYKLKDIQLEQSLSDIIPPDHHYTKMNEEFFGIFGGTNLVAIGLKVKEGEITDVENLARVKRITEQLITLPDVVNYRIVSIASRKLRFITVYHDEEFPEFPTISNTSYHAVTQQIMYGDDNLHARFKEFGIVKQPAVFGNFVSLDLKGTVILCDFYGEERYKQIYGGIQRILKEEEDANTTYYLGGRPILLGYLDKYMGRILTLFLAALGVTLILLLVMFRGFRGVVLPFIAGVVTIIWVLGMVAVLEIRMDMMSITVPFLILAVLVGHSVQILNRYYEEVAIHKDNKVAASETITALFFPGLASIITDAMGFMVLYILPFRILKSMSLMGTFGMVFTFIFVIIFIPCLLSLLRLPSAREWERVEKPGPIILGIKDIILGTIGRRSRYVIIGTALVIMIIMAVGTQRVIVGDTQEGSPYFWSDSPYNKDEYVLNHDFTGTNPLYVMFDTKKRFGLHNVRVANYIDSLSNKLVEFAEVKYTSSYLDVVKAMNFIWYDMDLAYYKIPEQDAAIGEFMEAFISSVEPEVTRPYFDSPQQWANLQVILKDHKTSTIRTVLDFIHEDVADNGAKMIGDICDIHVAAGIIPTYASIIEEIENKHLITLALVYLVDILICTIIFRSLLLALLVLFPLTLGVLVTYGIMGYANIGLFLYTVPIASMGMGLGVDYSIYVLSRWTEEVRKGEDRLKALEAMALGSGKAVLFTALAVALGAFTLMFSQLRFQAIMGGFLGVVILVDMIGAIIILPAIIGVFRVKRFAQRPAQATTSPDLKQQSHQTSN